MKKHFAMFVAVVVAGICLHAADPAETLLFGDRGYGEVVFLRGGSQGSLNSFPCAVEADNLCQLVVAGEQGGSIFIPAGVHTFRVFSQYPWPSGNSSDPRSCLSPPIKIEIKKGQKLYFEVVPVAEADNSRFSWLLRVLKETPNSEGSTLRVLLRRSAQRDPG